MEPASNSIACRPKRLNDCEAVFDSSPHQDISHRVLLPALALSILTAAFIIAKTGRDALLFQGAKGLVQLPLAYINIAAASLPLALLFVKTMKICGARAARVGILVFAAAAIASAAPFLEPANSQLLLAIFIFIPAVYGLLFASLWLLASDIFEKADKRDSAAAFSKMGAATLAGGMAGGVISKALAPYTNPRWLILLGAVLMFVVAAVVIYIQRVFPATLASRRLTNAKSGWFAPLRHKYSLTLLAISMLGALAGLLIDFQFYAAAAAAGMGSKGNANYFANFYILLNFSALLLQLFVTPKIQERVGLAGGLMVLPIALIGGAGFVTAAATAISQSVLRVIEGSIRSSVHRSIWEQAFIPVEAAERSAVKVEVDGVGARIAEIIGAVAILLWLKEVSPDGAIPMALNTRWIAWATFATVTLWLVVTQRVRTQTAAGDDGKAKASPAADIGCERFPDQCPCTTELGKGIA
ncbi:MAG TPA: hypothetical protein VH985_11555 [Candidatus Binatia bacterium]